MLDLDALGERGRARGVEEVGHVLRPHRALRGVDGAFRHRIGEARSSRVGKPIGARAVADADDALELRQVELGQDRGVIVLEEARNADQEPGVRVQQDVLQLAPCRPGVHPDHHGAEQRDREIGDQPFGPVAHEDRDLVAAAHAERMEAAREAPHFGAQLAVGIALARADERFALGIALCELVDELGEGAARRHHGASRRAMRAASGPAGRASISCSSSAARASPSNRATALRKRLRTPCASSGSNAGRRARTLFPLLRVTMTSEPWRAGYAAANSGSFSSCTRRASRASGAVFREVAQRRVVQASRGQRRRDDELDAHLRLQQVAVRAGVIAPRVGDGLGEGFDEDALDIVRRDAGLLENPERGLSGRLGVITGGRGLVIDLEDVPAAVEWDGFAARFFRRR